MRLITKNYSYTNWTTLLTGYQDYGSGLAYNPVTHRLVAVIATSASVQHIYTSDDYGESWTDRGATTNGYRFGVMFWGKDKFILATSHYTNNGYVKYSSNGESWTNSNLTNLNNRFFYDGYYDAVLDLYIIVGMRHYESMVQTDPEACLIYSSPDGITWTQRFINTSYVNAVCIIKTNTNIIVGLRGVDSKHASSTDGINWSLVSNGISGSTHYTIDYCYEPTASILTTITSSGIYKSLNDGQSYTLENSTVTAYGYSTRVGSDRIFCLSATSQFLISHSEGSLETPLTNFSSNYQLYLMGFQKFLRINSHLFATNGKDILRLFIHQEI